MILCGDRSGMTIPHNVTLPRSWLLRFVDYDSPYFNARTDTNLYYILIAPIWDLLEQLRVGRDYGKPRKIMILRFLILSM